MYNKLRKILIISSYAPPSIGGPQTFYNLLRDFPANKYFILTSYYNIDNLSATEGTWLKGEYIFYDNLNCNIKIKRGPQKRSALRKNIQKLKLLMKKFWIIRILVGFFVIFSQTYLMVRSGKKSIQRKKGDVLLGISDYGPAMISSYILHKITKKPLFIFLFDLYKGNFFPFPGGLVASIFEKIILKNTTTIIVTNQGTKDFYHKRYGDIISKKIVVIHNSVFPENYKNLDLTKNTKDKKKYTILFTGRIAWPQLRSIKNLIKAVNNIKDLNIQLKCYTPMPKEYLQSVKIIESEKIKILFKRPQDMPEVQGKADILFIPLSWHTKSQAIINTATPAKLTDYLIAGKPILIHAPSSSFLVKYAKDNNFAEVVDEENIEELKKSIKKLLRDEEFSNIIIKKAKETFFKNHDANKNAEMFKKIFYS
jgi:glycosyltransferase involved in cell wall biosynthesis